MGNPTFVAGKFRNAVVPDGGGREDCDLLPSIMALRRPDRDLGFAKPTSPQSGDHRLRLFMSVWYR